MLRNVSLLIRIAALVGLLGLSILMGFLFLANSPESTLSDAAHLPEAVPDIGGVIESDAPPPEQLTEAEATGESQLVEPISATQTPVARQEPAATQGSPPTQPAALRPTVAKPMGTSGELSVGLVYSGSGQGDTPATDLPAGVYRVIVRADDFLELLLPVVEEGNCSKYAIFTQVEGPFEGSTTYRSTGCRVRFAFSGAVGDWALAIEPVADEEELPLSPPVMASGIAPATTHLVELPQGEYPVVFETESSYSLVIPLVVNGPCEESPILVLSEPGRFETAYPSRGCEIIFQVSAVNAYWELSILSALGV